ncbi:putative short transient receptor potential channel 2-like protein [Bufo bufo]|uniref:putative short transient receptor potential channel 2-like protein n=1 Tax=Bufo bufo TaxID=8384 RepID=UPI001ABE11C9|nr:putative short transient receptor potential channel 2-like protein [Bufo bufo]XP_040282547.1 putative short transient receptor potential channel 2-like protein [Bufo bufo]XP_040282548.1 putative short transient receptor potential channel 2-like protein [Bufo bufo]
MAPIKISHIVSFSSQDPKHPVENLLMEDCVQPWLTCLRDRSRQLRVELQLERACHIGYIDIGNSGSAFLQIDVGRSIWPPDKGFTTLLPMATLMSPVDSRARKNYRGVRMFKEGDFLREAAAERWDRLRITCSQPFNKQEQFGLSFIRIRSTLSEEEEDGRPAPQGSGSSPVSPLHSRIKFTPGTEDPEAWNHNEEKLREKLQKKAPACMSRSARMLQLSAAKSRKRSRPITVPPNPPIPLHGGGSQQEDSPVSSGSCPETITARLHPSQKEYVTLHDRHRLKMVEARRRRRAQTCNSERHLASRKERGSPSTAQRPPETDTNICPICAGHFPAALLPLHAATCGEAPGSHSIVLSSDDDDWDDVEPRPAAPHSPVSWVQCPLCGFRFRDTEIEAHASTCGE